MKPAPFNNTVSLRLCRGFTLIEIMLVVGIMGIFLIAGIPSLYRFLHRQGFPKTVNDIVEVCNNARARAIMQSSTTEIIFHPLEGHCELSGTSAPAGTGEKTLSSLNSGAVSAQFSAGVTLEMLDVNQTEYKEAEIARVRFFPNGTCDEMTLILRSDRNEWRKISLEVTTGLVNIESDPQQFGR